MKRIDIPLWIFVGLVGLLAVVFLLNLVDLATEEIPSDSTYEIAPSTGKLPVQKCLHIEDPRPVEEIQMTQDIYVEIGGTFGEPTALTLCFEFEDPEATSGDYLPAGVPVEEATDG